MIDLQEFKQSGFAITEPLLNSGELQTLIALIEQHPAQDTNRGGLRDIMDRVPELRSLAAHPQVTRIVEQILGPDAFVVRATFFDKTADANWKVPWHQDVTIAVAERHETDGYGPWSLKEGVAHVQPPSEVLAHMVTVRIHLDPCPTQNGALRVMPGTHLLGRLNQNTVEAYVQEDTAVACEAQAGAALVMRPLLLHTSSAAAAPTHRRVLHFDFAAGNLAAGLAWRMRNQPQSVV